MYVQCSSYNACDASLQQRIVPERHFALLQAHRHLGHVLAEHRSAGQAVIHLCRSAEGVVLCQSVSLSGVLAPLYHSTSAATAFRQGRSSGWTGMPLARGRARVSVGSLGGSTRASPNAMVSVQSSEYDAILREMPWRRPGSSRERGHFASTPEATPHLQRLVVSPAASANLQPLKETLCAGKAAKSPR